MDLHPLFLQKHRRPSREKLRLYGKVVQFYFARSGSFLLCAQQLGYPTKNSLKAWCAEFADKRDLRTGYRRGKWQYNDEQKLRAVDHYVEQGHFLIHTIRSLGYPSRETLRAWIRELCPELGRTLAGRSSPIIVWSRGQRQPAAIALNTRTSSAKEVASAVGVARETLYNWHHQLLGHAPLKRMAKKRDETLLDQQREALLKELANLEVRVRSLRMERDILAKASELIKKMRHQSPRANKPGKDEGR